MPILDRLSISQRLYAVAGLLIAALAAVATTAWLRLGQVDVMADATSGICTFEQAASGSKTGR
jgi:L-cysteine desulfidase